MKKTCFLLLFAELFLGAYAFAASPEIKLSGRKDRVLTYQMRERGSCQVRAGRGNQMFFGRVLLRG